MSIIHSTEIWTKTGCLAKEDQINHAIFRKLIDLGFSRISHRIWKKENQTVIVCLVDDVRSCSQDYHTDLPYLFDKNTTVITDNYFVCPTVFSVVALPASFFGIYYYQPTEQVWDPKKDFAFQVNRIDARRCQLLADLAWRTQLSLGHVNFNCESRDNPQLLPPEAMAQFRGAFDGEEARFQTMFDQLITQVPIKNYDIEFDAVAYQAWINLTVETYASDTVVALSEKIFRSLVTPAPWTVYAGHYAVAYLESLGFDCMSDMINHGHYDRLKEIENKLHTFNWKSLEIVDHLKTLGISTVRERCITASAHNQQVLKSMTQRWPEDFTQWLDNLPKRLNSAPRL